MATGVTSLPARKRPVPAHSETSMKAHHARAPAKRATKAQPARVAPREKTFRIPHLEDDNAHRLGTVPPDEAPRASEPPAPEATIAALRETLARRIDDEMRRVEDHLRARLHHVAGQIDETTREISRLRAQTEEMRSAPVRGLALEVRQRAAGIDAA